MPIINIPLHNSPTFSISERRSNNFQEVLNSLSMGNQGHELSANDRTVVREAITRMGWLDSLCDWAFHHGTKREALNYIADAIAGETPEKRQGAGVWLLSNVTPVGFPRLFKEVSGQVYFQDDLQQFASNKIEVPYEVFTIFSPNIGNDTYQSDTTPDMLMKNALDNLRNKTPNSAAQVLQHMKITEDNKEFSKSIVQYLVSSPNVFLSLVHLDINRASSVLCLQPPKRAAQLLAALINKDLYSAMVVWDNYREDSSDMRTLDYLNKNFPTERNKLFSQFYGPGHVL